MVLCGASIVGAKLAGSCRGAYSSEDELSNLEIFSCAISTT